MLALARYDLACVAAREGRPDDCRRELAGPLRVAPGLASQLAGDPDFKSVRGAGWLTALRPGEAESA